MAGDAPHIEELTGDQLYALRYATYDKLELVGDPWVDDHILCCRVRVISDHFKPFEFSKWWCGWEFVAAVMYCGESPTAMKYVATQLAIAALEEDGE